MLVYGLGYLRFREKSIAIGSRPHTKGTYDIARPVRPARAEHTHRARHSRAGRQTCDVVQSGRVRGGGFVRTATPRAARPPRREGTRLATHAASGHGRAGEHRHILHDRAACPGKRRGRRGWLRRLDSGATAAARESRRPLSCRDEVRPVSSSTRYRGLSARQRVQRHARTGSNH